MYSCFEIGDGEWLLVMVAVLTRSTPDGVGGFGDLVVLLVGWLIRWLSSKCTEVRDGDWSLVMLVG